MNLYDIFHYSLGIFAIVGAVFFLFTIFAFEVASLLNKIKYQDKHKDDQY